MDNNYEYVNSYKHNTDNPDYVIKTIKDAYPESEGFKIDFKVEDAVGKIRERGSKTVKVEVYKEKKIKKHF